MYKSCRQDIFSVEFQPYLFWLSYLRLPHNLVISTCQYPVVTPGNLIRLRVHSDACLSGNEKRKASVLPDVYNFRLMGHNCDIVADGIDARIDELERASE
jgi:hypothetical protein